MAGPGPSGPSLLQGLYLKEKSKSVNPDKTYQRPKPRHQSEMPAILSLHNPFYDDNSKVASLQEEMKQLFAVKEEEEQSQAQSRIPSRQTSIDKRVARKRKAQSRY